MEKQQLLSEISQAATAGIVTQNEVLGAYEKGSSGVLPQQEDAKHLGLSGVMYYIGGAVIFLGISVLLFQNWDNFNTFTKIASTFGVAVAAYLVGILMEKYEEYRSVSQVFFLISALVSPVGLYVILDKLGLDVSTASVGVLVFLILTAIYLASFYLYRRTIFTLFSIIFGTILFHYVVGWIVGESLSSDNLVKVFEYRVLAIGLMYLCLGYYFKETSQKALTGVLYAFGSLGFLGAALALGGWQPNQNVFWELIYPLLVFGVIFLSIPLKSKSFLTFGSLFLIGYILKLTGEYFTEGLGWPLALVLSGLVIMVVGYYAVKINKKYLTTIS